MCQWWQKLEPDARIIVAYGGTEAVFQQITWPHRTYISDHRLRTRDHQRERQSYHGIMAAIATGLREGQEDRILMVECDVVPLRTGLTRYLKNREMEERADVLGVKLQRIDGTSHPHYLAHSTHAGFKEWMAQSRRSETGVVLMMLGCLSWWTRQAFLATAATPIVMPVYLELALATIPHQLGFRVRDLPEFHPDLYVVGEFEEEIEARSKVGRWLVHPCKKIWRNSRHPWVPAEPNA